MRLLLSSILSLAALAASQHKISGVVTDQTGAPIPDAVVEISGGVVHPPARLESDMIGQFGSAPLPPGAYTVRVTKTGFASQRLAVSLLSDKDSALRIVLPLATLARLSHASSCSSRSCRRAIHTRG